MKITTIRETLLNEILDFNNIEPFNYNGINGQYKFEDEDGEIVNVIFSDITLEPELVDLPPYLSNFIGSDVVNIGFDYKGIDSKWKTINLSHFLKILKTINIITHEYINRHQPNGLVIFAQDRSGRFSVDATKFKIYNIMTRQTNINGYGVGNIEYGTKGLLIYNKKFTNKKLK